MTPLSKPCCRSAGETVVGCAESRDAQKQRRGDLVCNDATPNLSVPPAALASGLALMGVTARVQIDLKQLLGTGRFSRSTTAAKPLAPGQAIRDSNFEDAVTSFVYTARTPFHPGRLHAFVTKHFHLHQRDFSADIVSEQDDAMTTLKEATAAIATAVKVLPAHSAAVRLAAELATKAAEAAMVGGARASGDAPKKVPEQLKAKAPASKAKPFGLLLRSKGQVRDLSTPYCL